MASKKTFCIVKFFSTANNLIVLCRFSGSKTVTRLMALVNSVVTLSQERLFKVKSKSCKKAYTANCINGFAVKLQKERSFETHYGARD